MPVALSDTDKERIRYHTGYQNVSPAASIQLGFPRASQASFLVEAAMERLLPPTVSRVLSIVTNLDTIEAQMMEANRRLKAQQLGELKLRNTNEEPVEQDLLEREYLRWAMRLADNLGVPLNVYSERFRELASGGGINVPVALPF